MNEVITPEIEKEVKTRKEQKPRKSRETTKDTPLKVRKRRCIKKMHEILEKYGPFSINISELSDEFYSDWEAVRGWYNGLLKSLDSETIDNISRKGEKMIENHLKRLEGIAEDSSTKERIAATTASFKGLEVWGNWLERFGRKQKIADKLDITGNISSDSAEEMRKIWEECNANTEANINPSSKK